MPAVCQSLCWANGPVQMNKAESLPSEEGKFHLKKKKKHLISTRPDGKL